MLSYYIVDLETTGLKADFHEIVQVSIIRCADRVQISRDIKAEFPDRASPEALRVTNKTVADILKGGVKDQVFDLVNSFLQEDGLTSKHRVIVGHNIVNFDRKFIHHHWGSAGKEFPADMWLDTMVMTKEFAKKAGIVKPKVNLQASLEMFKIAKVDRYHNARDDAQNTFLLWQRLMDENVDYLSLIKRIPHVGDDNLGDFTSM